jgi:hypothetical protein
MMIGHPLYADFERAEDISFAEFRSQNQRAATSTRKAIPNSSCKTQNDRAFDGQKDFANHVQRGARTIADTSDPIGHVMPSLVLHHLHGGDDAPPTGVESFSGSQQRESTRVTALGIRDHAGSSGYIRAQGPSADCSHEDLVGHTCYAAISSQ